MSSFDGSWHKRGHNSLYGIGCVIDVLTGLVVDYEVMSKYCHLCVRAATDLEADSPDFHFWQKGHKETVVKILLDHPDLWKSQVQR